MDIFPFDDATPWRTPETGPALVYVRATPDGDRELTIRPGADAIDLVAALATLPPGVIFLEHFGDVDAVLVFRQNPAGPPELDGIPLFPPSPLVPAGAARG
ncbi:MULTISPECIES: hypothetical protein [Pseudofrankia]|uniref:hypothetical protein n=1 Tax=Pseudofrankia TaxID=2994363 RepID=UPI000234C437|nr:MULTISPECIES: hypothetical protein [Pseudofrankia]OHV40824.1 hypothetical protein BCD49_39405 [Pseudofrankia sp. EUN1h]